MCFWKGVFVPTDGLLNKAFSTPSFQSFSFVSSLLVLLGLIKVSSDKWTQLGFLSFGHFLCLSSFVLSVPLTRLYFPFCSWPIFIFSIPCFSTVLCVVQSEDKVKPVLVVPGHLHVLEHIVRQDYFPKESVAVLEAFVSR